jgi:hypothetical protein
MSNFGKGESTWKPEFKGFTTQSLYLTMHDRVKLAVDVLLPKDLSSDEDSCVAFADTVLAGK